jgi:hypothetical protein
MPARLLREVAFRIGQLLPFSPTLVLDGSTYINLTDQSAELRRQNLRAIRPMGGYT